MQFLWAFMEKIAGKGLSFGLVMELIGYRSIALFPLAILIAALIAGVMVIGGMAEHYELAAVYTSGKGLRQVLKPLAMTGFLLAGASYFTSDYLIPAANLQFFQRLSDVQRKKPNLSIEPGAFNEDLANFTVYAARRALNTGDLLDVRIYDQSSYTTDPKINQIVASRGSFTSGNTEGELILTLHNGHHLREKTSRVIGGEFTRTEFKTYQLSFDLSQFELQIATDLTGSDHYALLPSWELQQAADSIREMLQQQLSKLDLAVAEVWPSSTPKASDKTERPLVVRSTDQPIRSLLPTITPLPLSFDLLPIPRKRALLQRIRNEVRGLKRHTQTVAQRVGKERGLYERYRFERHGKFGLAISCLFFVLIGGSAGAVVRKGGFGYPLLIGISCFASYILILQFCQRLMKAGKLSGPVAAWLPVFILALVMVLIYRRAVAF